MGRVGASHRERAALVAQPVIALVLHRRLGLLLVELRIKAAALDDKPRHDAVEDGAIEEATVDIGVEVGHRQRGVLVEQFHGEVSVCGLKTDHCAASIYWELIIDVLPTGCTRFGHPFVSGQIPA